MRRNLKKDYWHTHWHTLWSNGEDAESHARSSLSVGDAVYGRALTGSDNRSRPGQSPLRNSPSCRRGMNFVELNDVN